MFRVEVNFRIKPCPLHHILQSHQVWAAKENRAVWRMRIVILCDVVVQVNNAYTVC